MMWSTSSTEVPSTKWTVRSITFEIEGFWSMSGCWNAWSPKYICGRWPLTTDMTGDFATPRRSTEVSAPELRLSVGGRCYLTIDLTYTDAPTTTTLFDALAVGRM